MLFHADKNIKENLFNMYKKDLIERQARKDEVIFKEKVEDKNFIERIVKKTEEENRLRSMERRRVNDENMNSYNQLWRGKDEERKNRYYKVFDPKINYPSLNEDQVNQNKPFLARNRSYDFNAKIEFDSQRDHVNNILNPDYLGIRNLHNLDKTHKQEYHKIYKNCLDSQINTRVNIYDMNEIKDKAYPTLKRKEQEFIVKKHPYTLKDYETWNTHLNYNTITNPGPNLAYNKYLLQQVQYPTNNTPNTLRNSMPNLNSMSQINSYSPNKIEYASNESPFEKNYNYTNDNGNYMNENISQNDYQNYLQGQPIYNGYNSQLKDRLRMAGSNIMK